MPNCDIFNFLIGTSYGMILFLGCMGAHPEVHMWTL